MKTAFVVSHFDFRNDVRRIIQEAAGVTAVVILGDASIQSKIQLLGLKNIEFRPINEKKNTIRNRIWLMLYTLLKSIPKSKNNFYLTELFKASNTATIKENLRALTILKWMKRLPKFISYDFYLEFLQSQNQTKINDIDLFICFTAIADDYLLVRLLKENKCITVYVYSWDHPCKHSCFSKKVKYACWSDGIKDDLIQLQGIPTDQITVIGASQLGYIDEFNKAQVHTFKEYLFPYIYFGCAIGIPALVPSEVRMIELVAKHLKTIKPYWKLVVRPYPVLSAWHYYEKLRTFDNIILEDDFRTENLSIQDFDILQKINRITKAKAFFHLGTTMGLEACFTHTPSFILDFGYGGDTTDLGIFNFIHQYQNIKYLINLSTKNTIKSEAELIDLFVLADYSKFTELNQIVQQTYPLKSFKQFAEALINRT